MEQLLELTTENSCDIASNLFDKKAEKIYYTLRIYTSTNGSSVDFELSVIKASVLTDTGELLEYPINQIKTDVSKDTCLTDSIIAIVDVSEEEIIFNL
jgi:hypothetical protein